MWSVHENQTRNKGRGKDSFLKKQWQENWPPTRKNTSKGHPLDLLTEIGLKTCHFAHGALSPAESWDGPLVSAQLDTGNFYFVLIFLSCSAPCWRALRQPRSSQLGGSPITQQPEPWWPWRDKAPASWSPSPVWRKSFLCPRVRGGFGAPCGPPEKSGQPCAHSPQRAHPEAALLWTLRLGAQTEMEQNSSMTLLKTWLRNNQSLYGMQP